MIKVIIIDEKDKEVLLKDLTIEGRHEVSNQLDEMMSELTYLEDE